MKQEITYIYIYRYLWKKKDGNDICVKVLSGLSEEHERFIESIKQADDVEMCTRVYMSQVDVEQLENYQTIKEAKK